MVLGFYILTAFFLIVKRNPFFGIRLQVTLSDDKAWRDVHDFGEVAAHLLTMVFCTVLMFLPAQGQVFYASAIGVYLSVYLLVVLMYVYIWLPKKHA